MLSAYTVLKNCLAKRLRKNLQREHRTYEERKVQDLQKNWSEDPATDYQRQLSSPLSSIWYNTTVHALVGRIRELKAMYADTHYVFTHGQSLALSTITETIRELNRNFYPKLFHPFAPAFRQPNTVPFTENVDAFFEKYRLLQKHGNERFVDDHVNVELLSVDGYLYNTDSYESAIDFLRRNDNICTINDKNKITELMQGILSFHLSNRFVCQVIAHRLNQNGSFIQQEGRAGVLYALCVPKILVQDNRRNFVYRAHPFGKRCDCYPQQHIEVLEKLQRDTKVSCVSSYGYNPQYRMLTSRLMQNRDGTRTLGVRSFAVYGVKKSVSDQYQQQVKATIQAFFIYTYLFKLAKPLGTHEEESLLQKIKNTFKRQEDVDQAVLVPLLRRRAREGMISARFRDQCLHFIGVQDTGVLRENWMDESRFVVGVRDLWSSISSMASSFFGIFT
jgi:hypothetical protein